MSDGAPSVLIVSGSSDARWLNDNGGRRALLRLIRKGLNQLPVGACRLILRNGDRINPLLIEWQRSANFGRETSMGVWTELTFKTALRLGADFAGVLMLPTYSSEGLAETSDRFVGMQFRRGLLWAPDGQNWRPFDPLVALFDEFNKAAETASGSASKLIQPEGGTFHGE